MCGIFGFDKLTPRTRTMAGYLAWEMESRGHDSWGCTDGREVRKKLGAITAGWEPVPAGWDRGIWHTRAASVGGVTLDNAHPFTFTGTRPDGGAVIVNGIHNGHVSNHQELCAQHNRTFEVDSMHIFAHLAEGLPTAEIRGYGAIAWFITNPEYPEGRLCLAKFNMQDLHVAQLKTGEYVFCSLRGPILRAAGMAQTEVDSFYTLQDEKLYYFAPKNWDTADGVNELFHAKGQMKFGMRYLQQVTAEQAARGWGWDSSARANTNSHVSNIYTIGENRRKENKCAKYSCTGVAKRKDSLLCDSCFHGVWKGIFAEPAGVGA